MFNKTKISLILAVTLFIVSSCEEQLKIEPKQSISANVALSDITGVRAVLVSIYSRLCSFNYYGQRMMIAPDVLADNFRTTANPGGRYQNEEVNAPLAHIALDYNNSYAAINEANAVIGSIDKVTGAGVTDAIRNQIKGEALFLRALLYHDLLRIYAYEPTKIVNGFDKGVILRTEYTASAEQASLKTRSTVGECYALIEEDLKTAIPLLAPTTGTGVYRAGKAAAQALLARVYLYEEKWTDAAASATDALATAGNKLLTSANYSSSFSTNPHFESLFELNYEQNEYTTVDGVNNAMHSLTTKITSGGVFAVRATDELLNAYETGDVRRTVYQTTTDGGLTVSFSLKYRNTKGNFFDNIRVIRYSELLLIRAEARARSNNEAGARTDLTTLRTNRGLAAVPDATTGTALIDLIFNERRVELALEGHRWFDLKRRGLSISKPTGIPVLPYSDFKILAPFPLGEATLNPGLPQNPGY